MRGESAAGYYSYYRPTLLVLLKQRSGHGYELAGRMAELGFEKRIASSLYGVLRDMENKGLVASVWDMKAAGGPPRRIYSITTHGAQVLAEKIPGLARQHRALDALLGLYGTLEEPERDENGAGVAQRSTR